MPGLGARQKMPSKTWSCSELKDGDKKLTAIKREEEPDLDTKIKERNMTKSDRKVCYCLCSITLIDVSNLHFCRKQAWDTHIKQLVLNQNPAIIP